MSYDLNNLTLTLGFRRKDDSFYGIISGVKFQIETDIIRDSEINITIPVRFTKSKTELYEYIDQLVSDKLIKTHEFSENFLSIKMETIGNADKIPTTLSGLAKIIKKLDHEEVCSGCSDSTETAFYNVNGKVMNLCQNCRTNFQNHILENENIKPNYFTGLLGAVGGALVGSVLWIIIGYFNFFASIAGVAIAWASFKGYSFFNKKQTVPGVCIVAGSVLFSVLFAEYIGIFLEFLKEIPDLKFSQYFWGFPHLLSDPEFVVSLLPNLGLGLLFAGLGSYRTIKNNLILAKEQSNFVFEQL